MKLYYVRGNQNLGDAVNRIVFEDVLGITVEDSDFYDADLFGIGSILAKAFIHDKPGSNKIRNWWRNRKKYVSVGKDNRPLGVFGSGLIRDESGALKAYRELDFIALRGEKTRSVVEKVLNRDLSSVALGDPGLLMNRLVRPIDKKKVKIGVVSHYVDKGNLLVQQLINENEGAVEIDIIGDPVETLNRINECELILSSAMHGLIAADSLGIPNKWIQISDNLMGGDFKFHDYYSAFGVKAEPWDLRTCDTYAVDVDAVKSGNSVSQSMVEQVNKRLLAAFDCWQKKRI